MELESRIATEIANGDSESECELMIESLQRELNVVRVSQYNNLLL